MRFRNDTGKEVLVRTDDGKGLYIWRVIGPGEIVDIPEYYATNLGFVDENIKSMESSIGETKVETKIIEQAFVKEDPNPEFMAELKATKGISKETLKNILGVFPTKERLKQAIKEKIELPFSDKIDKILREKYG